MIFPFSKLSTWICTAMIMVLALVSFEAQAQQVPGRFNSSQTLTKAPTLAQSRVRPPAPRAAPRTALAVQNEWDVSSHSTLVRVPLNKLISVRLPGKVRNVIIGNPTIANIVGPNDGTRDHVYLLALLVGSTSIIFEDAKGNILFKGDIQVDVDVEGIQAAISEMMPDENIEVVSQRDAVFLKGFVRSAAASVQVVDIARRFVVDPLNVINALEVLGSRQVIMQVHVSEMKRSAIKELGFNFNYTKNLGNAANNVAVNVAGIAKLATTAFATGSILPGITGFGNISYQVLEENGLAKTLAEPALTAISGETATFMAGGTFPMVTAIDTNGTKSYTQQPFGVLLSFTPTVMDKGQINLHIATEVSDRDDTRAIDGIPAITRNRTETIVDMQSGGSLIISGLIQNDFTNTISGIPGLKDLPILGALFRSEAFLNKETELVVTVTAYLAEPVGNSARLALPTDGFVTSSDMDLYLLGRLHKEYAKSPLPPYATPLTGPYGYIME